MHACTHKFSDNLKEGASMFKTTSKALEKDVSFIIIYVVAKAILCHP